MRNHHLVWCFLAVFVFLSVEKAEGQTISRTLVLEKGINLITLPVTPTLETTGDGFFLSDLCRVTGATFAVSVNGGKFSPYIHGSSVVDLAVDGGKGYVLFSPVNKTVTLRGLPWAPRTLRQTVSRGLNAVGLPRGVPDGFNTSSLKNLVGTNGMFYTTAGRFHAFLPSVSGEKGVSEGEAYLWSAGASRVLTLPARWPESDVLLWTYKLGEVGPTILYLSPKDEVRDADIVTCGKSMPSWWLDGKSISLVISSTDSGLTCTIDEKWLYKHDLTDGKLTKLMRMSNDIRQISSVMSNGKDLVAQVSELATTIPFPIYNGLAYVVDMTTGKRERLTTTVKSSFDMEGYFRVVQTRDRQQAVYYVSNKTQTGQWGLFRADPGKKEETLVGATGFNVGSYVVSPDDRWLVYSNLESNAFFWMRRDGSGLAQMMILPGSSFRKWVASVSPDGEEMFVVEERVDGTGYTTGQLLHRVPLSRPSANREVRIREEGRRIFQSASFQPQQYP